LPCRAKVLSGKYLRDRIDGASAQSYDDGFLWNYSRSRPETESGVGTADRNFAQSCPHVREPELLRQAGLSVVEALAVGTVNGAKAPGPLV